MMFSGSEPHNYNSNTLRSTVAPARPGTAVLHPQTSTSMATSNTMSSRRFVPATPSTTRRFVPSTPSTGSHRLATISGTSVNAASTSMMGGAQRAPFVPGV